MEKNNGLCKTIIVALISILVICNVAHMVNYNNAEKEHGLSIGALIVALVSKL